MRKQLWQKMSVSRDKFKIAGIQPPEPERGSSSIAGTEIIRSQLPDIFSKYNITSMFDAGSNDGAWAKTMCNFVKYSGGDINPEVVKAAKINNPDLDIVEFDVLEDLFPSVDLVFVRDVSIHLTNFEKQMLLINFVKSQVPWLMITQLPNIAVNHDIPIDCNIITAETNWCLAPWNFPTPVDSVYEYTPGGRCLALWHRDQLVNIL